MSLVTYDSYVQLVFGLMKMDKANKERSKAFVQSIVDGSSTNLCGGLIKGTYMHAAMHKPHPPYHAPKLKDCDAMVWLLR